MLIWSRIEQRWTVKAFEILADNFIEIGLQITE